MIVDSGFGHGSRLSTYGRLWAGHRAGIGLRNTAFNPSFRNGFRNGPFGVKAPEQ